MSNNLSEVIEEYLTLRRHLGFELRKDEYVLKNLMDYMKKQKKRHITTQIALEFVASNPECSLISQVAKYRMIRRFAIYLSMYDIKTEVPENDALLAPCYRRRSPYIFSNKEIIKFLMSCRDLLKGNSFNARSYHTFFGLIAVTGMRTNEALTLFHDSVDLKNGILTILESKFRKTRKIPIHPSTKKALKDYCKLKDQHFKQKKTSDYFFVDSEGQKLKDIHKVFKKACKLAGILKKEKPDLRILNFRHSFAVNTIINSYESQIDVYMVLPILAMYLGHENPKHTYWYLTATPKLMNLIIDRLEKKFGGQKL